MKLVQAVKNATSAPASSRVHTVFTFDENEYLQAYHSYLAVPSKFVSFLTFAIILNRCRTLGLRFDPSTNLPLLTSTRNLIVFMAVPVAGAIMLMISTNGLIFLDEGSRGWVVLTAGCLLPSLNLSSSLLVARFWSSRLASLADQESGAPIPVVATDPAKTQPVKTLLIVAFGLVGDIVFSTFTIFPELSNQSINMFMAVSAFLLALGYLLTTGYFFFSGIQVLRSLSSSNKSRKTMALKTMAIYLLMDAGFTLMIIASFISAGTRAYLASVEGFFFGAFLTCKEEEGGGGGGEGGRERGGESGGLAGG